MSHESDEIGSAVRDAGRWVTESLDVIAEGQWGGGGLADIVGLLRRLVQVLERQAVAMEAIEEALEGKGEQ